VQHFVTVVARTLLGGGGAESALPLAAPSGYAEEIDPALQSRGLGARALYPLDRSALLPKARLQTLLDSFLEGPNKMVSICEPLESQSQLDNLYGQSENISDASLCLILLQLAVGARNLGVIPQVCSTLYEGRRRVMDSGIENIQSNWLWVVQAHVLDCIYSMNGKPHTCWLVLGKPTIVLLAPVTINYRPTQDQRFASYRPTALTIPIQRIPRFRYLSNRGGDKCGWALSAWMCKYRFCSRISADAARTRVPAVYAGIVGTT
jgi:hypothetical protein